MTKERDASRGDVDDQYQSPSDQMWRAIHEDDPESARRLLDEGFDPDADLGLRWTPLRTAVSEGRRAIIELLIEAGADVAKRDDEGRSALDIADAELDPHDLADLLIKHGAIRNPDIRKERDEEIAFEKAREAALEKFYDASSALQSHYHDDRMFVYEISRGLSGNVMNTERHMKWSLIGRRNVHGFPAASIREFATYEEAMEFHRRVAPTTPRVSLGNRPPDTVPTWEEYQRWVDEIEAAAKRQGEPATLLKWPKPRSYNKHGKRQRYGSSSPPCLQERALRAAIRRRLDKPRKGKRLLSPAPVQSMVRLVGTSPELVRSKLVRTRSARHESNKICGTRVRPLRRDLCLENPRQTLSPARLGMILRSETNVSLAAVRKPGRKSRGYWKCRR